MKQLITTTVTALSIVVLAGCGGSTVVAPSQNSALNSVSSSTIEKKAGWMQKGLDSWLEEEWTPTVEKNEEIRQKYMEVEKPVDSLETNSTQQSELTKVEEVKYVEKKNKPFTLQEYLDKADVYFEAQVRDEEHSNIKKLESMPVIGK